MKNYLLSYVLFKTQSRGSALPEYKTRGDIPRVLDLIKHELRVFQVASKTTNLMSSFTDLKIKEVSAEKIQVQI